MTTPIVLDPLALLADLTGQPSGPVPVDPHGVDALAGIAADLAGAGARWVNVVEYHGSRSDLHGGVYVAVPDTDPRSLPGRLSLRCGSPERELRNVRPESVSTVGSDLRERVLAEVGPAALRDFAGPGWTPVGSEADAYEVAVARSAYASLGIERDDLRASVDAAVASGRVPAARDYRYLGYLDAQMNALEVRFGGALG